MNPYCHPPVVVVVVVVVVAVLDSCRLVHHFRVRLVVVVVVVVVGTAALLLQQFVLDRVVNVETRDVGQPPAMVATKHQTLLLTVGESKHKPILDNNNNESN